MTPSQASSLRRVTNTLQDMAHHEGGLSFAIDCSGRSVVLIATNSETAAWYQRSIGVGMRIGSRGAVKVYASHGLNERDIMSRLS